MAGHGSWTFRLCLAGAALLHGAVLVFALGWTVPPDLTTSDETPIVVAILTAEQLDAAEAPMPAPVPAEAPAHEPAMDAAASASNQTAGTPDKPPAEPTKPTPLRATADAADEMPPAAAEAADPPQSAPAAQPVTALPPVLARHDSTETAAVPAATPSQGASAAVAEAEPAAAEPVPVTSRPAKAAPLIDYTDAIRSASLTEPPPPPVETGKIIEPERTSAVAQEAASTPPSLEEPAKRPQAKPAAETAKADKKKTDRKPGASSGSAKQTRTAGDGGSKTVKAKGAAAGFAANPTANLGGYSTQVRARIASRKPGSSAGTGTTTIRFGIGPSGELLYARVARSSGNAGLDRAVLAAVMSAAPFPPPPPGTPASRLNFSIPFMVR